MIPFSDTVKMLRRERNLTLEKVAGRLGSHKGYVSGIENRKVNPPSVKIVRKYAKLFDKNEQELICLAEIEKSPKELQQRYGALEELRAAAQSYKTILNTLPRATEPPEPGIQAHRLYVKMAWDKVNEVLDRLNHMFIPASNGNGHGHQVPAKQG